MTEKQDRILLAALQLFSQEGFHATSTKKVAKLAGVSEGLIFRHFKNKEGLVNVILQQGEDRFRSLFVDIVMENDPREVLRKTITMTRKIDVSEYDFWRLQFKLKWELEINGDKKMEPLKMALNNAFTKLEYAEPEKEAQLLLLFTEGLGSAILKGSEMNAEEMIAFLLNKYKL